MTGTRTPAPGPDHEALIRTARAEDVDALYAICLRTGDAGRDASALYRDPRLLGEVYVGPYLAADPSLCLVAVDDADRPVGYALAAAHTGDFEAWCARSWYPHVRQRPLQPADGPTGPAWTATADDALLARFRAPLVTPPDLVAAYPAHMHIDLLPETQGRGLGRRLMQTLMRRLHGAGAHGVHLGVDPRNEGALAFYARLGFTRWPTQDESIVLVRALP